ncbi:hypothetical protein B0H14DRAFT_3743669 [Mycena olivaceomarginata]|nr:hypothetical protein B0H14DRAFT_3743669 [Mycena olivaceomarginata]
MFFQRGPIKPPPPKPIIVKKPRPCTHLSGGKYNEYIERTETRSLGGVSVVLRSRVIRQVLPYKPFEPSSTVEAEAAALKRDVQASVPSDGNDTVSSTAWTAAEHAKVDAALRGFARWEVLFGQKLVRSTHCDRLTTNVEGICDACKKVAKDESLLAAINRKNREANQPLEIQHEVLIAREKYSQKRFHDVEGRQLDALLKDPIAFTALKTLQKGDTTGAFLQLYEAVLTGKLKKYQTVLDLCTVVADVIKREGTSKMSGIRYPAHYLNFATLMRSYGGNSAKQFGILSGEIPLPSTRHLRSLIAKSEDALNNPYLIFENIARVKRLVDSIQYSGPVAVAGDCTKVRARLSYSTDFGAHILGSVWELKDCIAEDPEDIERVIDKITAAKAQATQVRAILIKVPLPHIPPLVVALLPTDGKDDALKIVEQQLKLLEMAADLALPVISFAADGAASELAAQNAGDENWAGGFKSRCGSCEEDRTESATAWDENESLGADVLANQTLIELYNTGESGLLSSDVRNVDKQDDGPARRLFHVKALQACTIGEGDEAKIRAGFGGLFVYLFVLGVLFDAWLNRTMTVKNRVLAVLRARFFLHFWPAHIVNMSSKYPDLYSTARSFISAPSFHIFNRLCDTLLLLVVIYSRHYPGQPFCPWLLGTEFVEHFFGLARMMLPNFTWAEFIKLVQHVMIRQRILLSGKFKEKRDRKARVGYVLDFDATPLTPEDLKLAKVTLTDVEMNSLVDLAFLEACAICTQILHIPAPKPTTQKPLTLTPLGIPPPHTRVSPDDSDSDDDGVDPDDEVEEIEELFPNQPEEARMIALATQDTARYSALCDDYDDALKELEDSTKGPNELLVPRAVASCSLPPAPTPLPVPSALPPACRSEFLDAGKVSISKILQARLHWQAGTTARSEKVSQIDSKYALSRLARENVSTGPKDDTEPEKMTLQEAANVTRIVQEQNSAIQESQPKKTRVLRWKNFVTVTQMVVDTRVLPNLIAKNVQVLNPLEIGYWTVMWNGTRFYIGEILDIYKKGANSRYGSIQSTASISGVAYISLRVYLPLTSTGDDSDDEDETGDTVAPMFSCHHRGSHIRLHTHARADHLVFNLGPHIFEPVLGEAQHRTLMSHAASCWSALTKKGALSTELKLTIKLGKPKEKK